MQIAAATVPLIAQKTDLKSMLITFRLLGLTAALGLFALLGFSSSVGARTWLITPDGTGDAPYLAAAMDSASLGDTVLVAPGEYEIGSVVMADGIVLLSMAGPDSTRIVEYPGAYGGIACSMLAATTQIRGFWFDGFDSGGSTGTGAINIVDCLDLRVSHCIFTNNDFAGVALNSTRYTRLENNTFVGNVVALNVVAGSGACINNIFWDPVEGLTPNMVIACNDALRLEDIPVFYLPANFSADPLFCAVDNYRLRSNSPCAPGNSPYGPSCQLIGALPADCTTNPTERRTWGSVKALYRGQR